jgi:predicted deacylase
MLRVLLISLFFSSFSHAVSYEKIVAQMKSLAEQYPKRAKLKELVKNDIGESIYLLELLPPQKAEISSLVVGAHHGNEQDSAPLAVSTAKYFLELWSRSARQDNILFKQRLFIVPVLNVNGFKKNRREELNRQGRRVDPNRDYPDPCVKKDNLKLNSTAALAKLVRTYKDITRAVSIHGYIGTLTYPWGIFTDDTKTPDHAYYKQIFESAAKQNQYRIGTHADVIYPAIGAFEDWVYHEQGVWSMLVEMKRRADIGKDTRAIVQFLAKAPVTRSRYHAHTGTCRKDLLRRGGIRWSRP